MKAAKDLVENADIKIENEKKTATKKQTVKKQDAKSAKSKKIQSKKSVDKKIKTTLEKMLKDERETYETFFDEFGQQLKFGCYDNYGMNKDVLIDLIMFKSSKEDKYVTLKEYVANMQKNQKDIYYASGEDIAKIKELPQIEKVLEK